MWLEEWEEEEERRESDGVVCERPDVFTDIVTYLPFSIFNTRVEHLDSELLYLLVNLIVTQTSGKKKRESVRGTGMQIGLLTTSYEMGDFITHSCLIVSVAIFKYREHLKKCAQTLPELSSLGGFGHCDG